MGYRSGSTMVQVMACWLTAPSHYLNQCWLFIKAVLRHYPMTNFTRSAQDIDSQNAFENPKKAKLLTRFSQNLKVFNAGCLNPLCAKCFRGNIKHIFTFHIIPPYWYDTGGWNPSSHKTRTYPFYIVNIMAAGVLVTQGARTSAAMILT